MELYHSESVAYLLERIAERIPYIRPATLSFDEQKTHNSSFQDVQVSELSSPTFISHLRERGINIELVKRKCKELRFENNSKTYFAIGSSNTAGGYELCNHYFKGCIAPKDITHIRQQDEQRAVCYLFEGFMDYLSLPTVRVNNNLDEPRTNEQDYVVLNSVTNLSKAE